MGRQTELEPVPSTACLQRRPSAFPKLTPPGAGIPTRGFGYDAHTLGEGGGVDRPNTGPRDWVAGWPPWRRGPGCEVLWAGGLCIPHPGQQTEPEPRGKTRWDQLFIQQKHFIHSKINHRVYSADIKKKKNGVGGARRPITVPLDN